MKAIFMGTPDFGVPTLTKMIKSDFIDVTLVVTQPDKPKGRGQKIQYSPIKELALKHNIEVFQPDKIKKTENIDFLKKYDFDVIIVVAYGQILSEEILNLPKKGCINVHGSLLPKYRGAAPIHKAIIDGEKETGVTIMYMDKGLDTGDMILKKSIPIGEDDTTGIIYEKLSEIGGDALILALKDIENNIINREKQDDSKSSYAHLLKKENGIINWDDTSQNIKNLVRGLTPWPNAFTFQDGISYKILEVSILNCESNKAPGTIIDILSKQGIVVKTKDSAIIITKVQKQFCKKMDCPDFLRGNKMEIDSLFSNNDF